MWLCGVSSVRGRTRRGGGGNGALPRRAASILSWCLSKAARVFGVISVSVLRCSDESCVDEDESRSSHPMLDASCGGGLDGKRRCLGVDVLVGGVVLYGVESRAGSPGSGVDGAESVVHSIAVAGDGGESCGAGGAPSAAAEGVFFLRRRLLLVAVGGAAVVGAVLAARARALTSPACSPSSSAAGSTTAGGLRTGLRRLDAVRFLF